MNFANNNENCIEFLNNQHSITKTCEKPTPLGVGWIAQNIKIMYI